MHRPTSVTVFGILNLLLAAWGLLGAVISALMFLVPQPQMGLKNPALELIQKNQAYAIFLKVSLVVGAVAAIVLAVAGVGLLMMKLLIFMYRRNVVAAFQPPPPDDYFPRY